MLTSVRRLLERNPARKLGLAGGLFANVRLNQLLAEKLPIDEIFVFPPMGDEGLPVGGVLAYLLRRDGMVQWLKERRRLENVYLGRDYDSEIDGTLRATPGVRQIQAASPAEEAARRIAVGEIGAIYTGRMEYGPRALGARSILASPQNRETHEMLNKRLDRTEFMPFAPVVAAGHAAEIFDISNVNSYACRFMTIACKVREPWRARIPAVWIVSKFVRSRPPSGRWRAVSLASVSTGTSVLLRSCAMPPANVPNASSFCECWRSVAAFSTSSAPSRRDSSVVAMRPNSSRCGNCGTGFE